MSKIVLIFSLAVASAIGATYNHRKLANDYRLKAERLEAQSKEHWAMASVYEKSPTICEMKHPMAPRTAAHCRYFSERYASQAKEARALAASHEEIALRATR